MIKLPYSPMTDIIIGLLPQDRNMIDVKLYKLSIIKKEKWNNSCNRTPAEWSKPQGNHHLLWRTEIFVIRKFSELTENMFAWSGEMLLHEDSPYFSVLSLHRQQHRRAVIAWVLSSMPVFLMPFAILHQPFLVVSNLLRGLIWRQSAMVYALFCNNYDKL